MIILVNAVRYKPQATVTFYTENGNLVTRASGDPNGAGMDNDVISIYTIRDMGADAPTFSINLTRNHPWHLWIGSNDRVDIQMGRPPESNLLVFRGLVDDARKSLVFQGDKPQRAITITGRGVSKAFIQFDVGYVPEAEYVDGSLGWVQNKGVTLAGAHGDEIMEGIWTHIAKPYVNYSWGSKNNLFEIMSHDFSSRKSAILKDDMNLLNYQGSLWALFRMLADEPFNEIFWEIRNNKPVLISRVTPFSSSNWKNLPTHIITDDDVTSENIGRSDVETYTLFSAGIQTSFSSEDITKTTGIVPIWYKPYSKKYGIKRLHKTTLFAASANASDASGVDDVIKMYQHDLYNWYIKNNSFYNGTFLVKGSNRFKVGNRLLYKSIEDDSTIEYYITSVSHTFINFGSWVTLLGVTRGIQPDKRFTSPYGAYTDYSGLGLAIYDPAKAQANIKSMVTTGLNALSSTDPMYGGPLSSGDLDKAKAVIDEGKKLMQSGRIKYVLGGKGIMYGEADCSQFTQYCYSVGAGMDIGVPTSAQIKKGTSINRTQAQPGDLVFFTGTIQGRAWGQPSHVGIYMGNDTMISNTSSGIKIDKNIFSGYWGNYYLSMRRVLKGSSDGTGTTVSGKVMKMTATAYGTDKSNGGAGWGSHTASGTVPKEGRTIAVDRNQIPLGSRVKIECSSYPSVNGTYIAEDVGGAIKTNRIDIYFDDIHDTVSHAHARMMNFGRRTVKVSVLK